MRRPRRKCTGSRRGLPGRLGQAIGDATADNVKDRSENQAKPGDPDHAEKHSHAQSLSQLRPRACGKGPWHITLEHVLPNITSVLIVQVTIRFATAILAEAALSYLGLGTQPPQPSWGRMLSEAQTLLFQMPMLAVYPGVAIALAVLGLNLLGDGLRDLLDPRLARKR